MIRSRGALDFHAQVPGKLASICQAGCTTGDTEAGRFSLSCFPPEPPGCLRERVSGATPPTLAASLPQEAVTAQHQAPLASSYSATSKGRNAERWCSHGKLNVGTGAMHGPARPAAGGVVPSVCGARCMSPAAGVWLSGLCLWACEHTVPPGWTGAGGFYEALL